MVTHLAFIIKNGKKQKTLALNNRKREKAKSTQKKRKHTYLINGRTYISNNHQGFTSPKKQSDFMVLGQVNPATGFASPRYLICPFLLRSNQGSAKFLAAYKLDFFNTSCLQNLSTNVSI